MRFFCEFCGGPNDSVGRCLRRCEAESRGPRRSAYTSAEMAAYNAGAAAGYKQAEARIKELEAQLASERRETERLRAVYNRSTSCDIARERDEAEARLETVKAMHQPREFRAYVENQLVPETPRLCRACDEDWPCPTVRAAEGKP